jgi:hypothetical protein
MNFICPTCGKTIPLDLPIIISHTEEHIIDVIKRDHPDWVEKDGICKKCYEFYKSQLHPEEK